MANNANIKAVITADDRASSVLKGFGDNVDGMSARLKQGLFAAGAAAVAFGVTSVKAFSESEDLIAQTNAVLKSTGGIAGVTASEVTKLASAWQKQTKYSDEAVRGAENVLLTFTGISKDIFPQTTQAVLDISTALHEDLQSASIQVGKALQDPILGVTALRRVGVNFSEAQKDVIKNLVETGQKAQAQALILKELQTEFGGSAKAAGETFSGKLTILKNQLNDLQEVIGKFIVNGLFAITNAFSQLSGSMAAIVNFLNGLFGPSLRALADTLQTRVFPQIMQLWNAIEPGFTTALQILATVVGAIVVAALWTLINTLNIVISVFGFIIRVINDVIAWFGNLGAVIINVFRAIPGAISDALKGIENIITAPFRSAFNTIMDGVNKVKNAVGSIKGGAADTAQNIADPFHLFHRASGGSVTANTPYIVGEEGQELFVPNQSGTIIPNNKLGTMQGSSTININLNAGAFMGSDVEARKYAQTILNHMQSIAGARNMTLGQLIGN